ncbi:MAG TPA: universal stress protein [Williamwhitmania sp.]|nr:universal stress protein [Williamwhitmania sp.]
MDTTNRKKVLIALDFDPTAQKVAEIGFSLGKAMDAEITLLHVILEPVNYTSTGHVTVMGFAGYPQSEMGMLQTDGESALKKVAQQYLDKSKQHLGDRNILTVVKEGDFGDSILKTAEDLHANVIVLGSHSRKWMENVLMGSVTEKILQHTSIPLFIVPTKKK